jgi:flagellar assembly factor FliW
VRIDTKYFGQLKIEKEQIIYFEQGIPGFPEEKKFVFLPLEDTEFLIMQSIQTPMLAFVTNSPFTFFKDYQIKLSDTIIEQLKLKSEKDVFILVILSVQKPFSKTTVNLVAPLVINTVEKLGKQVILENTPYKTRQLLLEQESEEKEDSTHAGSQAQIK